MINEPLTNLFSPLHPASGTPSLLEKRFLEKIMNLKKFRKILNLNIFSAHLIFAKEKIDKNLKQIAN